MNCKQGDLALVIAGWDAGKTVTCLEPLSAGFWRDDLPWPIRQRGGRQRIEAAEGPLWRVDRLIDWGETPESRKYGLPTSMCIVPDKALMPIRPDADAADDATPLELPVKQWKREVA